jgi:hypothetical protein
MTGTVDGARTHQRPKDERHLLGDHGQHQLRRMLLRNQRCDPAQRALLVKTGPQRSLEALVLDRQRCARAIARADSSLLHAADPPTDQGHAPQTAVAKATVATARMRGASRDRARNATSRPIRPRPTIASTVPNQAPRRERYEGFVGLATTTPFIRPGRTT